MRNAALPFVLLPLTLSCGAPRAAAAQEPLERTTTQGAPRSLRFGDPDELLYQEPYFPGASYDAAIPAPDALLGQRHGTRLAHHAEILACFRAWEAASQRIRVEPYGRTHEGRELVVAVITSPANHARLDAIKADLAKLYDPRGLADAEAERIVQGTPAVAWMGYSIHGDELSGADASVAFAHHLVASTDREVSELLERTVVVIDPCMNPDGRERIIGMVEQSAGYTPNLDYASMQRGRWPFGRGNHYLFDMNRDWMAGTQPETEGRWRIARSFCPQLFVDAHELMSLDTFLFYPQAPPVNPALPPKLIEWQKRYAADAARAFDERGWSYYTREWADAWGPFFSDSWGSLLGATGILYEQARTAGFALRRASGEVITYRETVHHQAVTSLANLRTLAANREAVLRDYAAEQRRIVAADTPGNERTFVVRPGSNADRTEEFLRILRGQGIEAFVARSAFEAKNVVTALGERAETQSFPAGTLLVPARQPQGRMVRAFLEFDQRMTADDLRREREDLEQKNVSRIYDVTSWSLPLALDLDAAWCDALEVEREPLPPAAAGAEAEIVGPGPAIAWVVSGADDASVSFAARALERGLAVNVADEPLTIQSAETLQVPRGSLLVRAAENPGERAAVEEKVLRAAREAGVERVHRLATGLSPDDTPDLGGTHLHLLVRPRVALLANSPVLEDLYGHLWFELDSVLGVPFSLIDAQALGGTDLRRYNVLVLPPHDGGLGKLLAENAESLKSWVRAGGTLIACDNAAAELTSGKLGLSAVTLREHALEDLTPYRIAAEREAAARTIEIDEKRVWGDAPPPDEKADAPPGGEAPGDSKEEEESDPYAPKKVSAVKDRWLARFSPIGVTLRGLVDAESWITSGAGAELPVFFYGSDVFLSKEPVRTAVRLAGAERLRLGGLVWPEARERIEHSAWLTVESVGNGQVILFAGMPAFRGYHRATARLFANAVVLGPGLGASAPIGW